MSDLTASSAIITIENIEALRAYEPVATNQVVQVLYHTYSYYGGGRFVATNDTSSSDDNGLVIVTSKGRRWKRLLEDSDRGNILNWGADPSGKQDSAPAFMAAIADKKTRMVVIPHEGRYSIEQSVDLDGRVSLIGGSRDHFGQRSSYSSVVAGPGLDGPMFINVGKNVQGIAFDGRTQKSTGLSLQAYVNVIKDCTFDYFDEAIIMPGGVDVSFVDNTFTRINKAIQLKGAPLCTTCRFIRNQFQYVHDCVVVEGELYGSSFVDNIFERVSGKAIHARVVYHCHFQGNWWEHRNGAEDGLCVSADSYQQLFNNTASANYCVFGWTDIFSDEKHDNRIGGVMTGAGQVVVRAPTGQALRVTSDTIKSECATWTAGGDLTLESGYDRIYSNVGDFYLVAGNNNGQKKRGNKDGSVFFTSRGDDESWNGQLRFVTGKDNNGKRLTQSYGVTEWGLGGISGEADVKCGDKVVQSTFAIPQQVLWDGGPSTGTGCFASIDDSEPGRVRFLLEDGAPELRNFLIHCTIHTRGFTCDGITHINSYGGSWRAYRRAKGFDVYFVDRATGEARTPDRFCLMLAHVDGNKLAS